MSGNSNYILTSHYYHPPLEQVRPHHQEAPLPALRPAAVLQVLGQGDAHHEVQPQQARQSLRCLLGPSHSRGRGRRESFLSN